MTVTDEELLELAGDLESDRVERKASLDGSAKERVGEAICAFANDLPGRGRTGFVLIGVDDKTGQPTGLDVTDRLLLALAAFRSDGNILPLPMLTVEKRQLAGRAVALVGVEPSQDPPVRYYGRVCVRVGPRRAIASRDEERVLTERRRSRDLPFDRRAAPGATLEELDLDLFRRAYLPRAVADEVLAENERSLDEQLAALHLLALAGAPTYGAVLLLGRDPLRWLPGAAVQFVRYDGKEVTAPIIDQKVLSGPVAELLPRIDDLAKLNVRTSTVIEGGPQEQRMPDYPLVALQQLLRNACLHRTYEVHAPVYWFWYADRVEIHSPGGLYGRVNEDNFGQPGSTDYRNPTLATGLKVLGFVQSFGMGIALARKACSDNGNPPPEFTLGPTSVLATLRPRQ